MDQKTQDPVDPGESVALAGAVKTTVCARCGAAREGLPITWTCSVENGSRVYFCDGCSRANLRSIEGRLDSAWW
ncbi:hypothetical protein [Actinacidiphila oryziradicis]|uniref:Uncharacterized protein n=1 Tax=Actinacidiphila oryziradicis TaxID=2571141 RepID=A0A4U0SR00_9ACTN|nr:hypothetical protein [Actinacidiphila oryziradicis]TKA10577.1 hypothetical protein FCI23_16505 [Actinacidiphila oryziradicis]